MKCPKCKHKWLPRVEHPQRCPRCGKWLSQTTPLVTALAICFLSLAGCATGKTGVQLYADGLDCIALKGNVPECEALQERGLAQALRDAGSGLDYGDHVTIKVR